MRIIRQLWMLIPLTLGMDQAEALEVAAADFQAGAGWIQEETLASTCDQDQLMAGVEMMARRAVGKGLYRQLRPWWSQ